MRRAWQKGGQLLQSKILLILTLLLFTGLSGFMVIHTSYPQAYDESYHVGLIEVYEHRLSPFITEQPEGADAYGAVARTPSYLYHYALSFPLRLVRPLLHTKMQEVYFLRSFNILMGLLSLVLVWKLSRRFRLSPAASNLVVIGVALTPSMFNLAAQVNYDNLLIPATLLSIYLAWTVADFLKQKVVPLQKIAILTALTLFACLIKYAYLPVALALGLYIIVVALRSLGFGAFMKETGRAWARLSWRSRSLLLVLILVASGLWVQRYGINMALYKNPKPQCGQVLSLAHCQHYGPWYRNYLLHEHKQADVGWPVVSYMQSWWQAMTFQLFSIAVVKPGMVVFRPVQILVTAFKVALLLAGAALLYVYGSYFSRRIPWGLLIGVIGCYILVLWLQNILDFHNLGKPVAIQGRYLLPILPLIYMGMARAYVLGMRQGSSFRVRQLSVMRTNVTLVMLTIMQREAAIA